MNPPGDHRLRFTTSRTRFPRRRHDQQVVPDQEKVTRVTAAMLTMKRFDIAQLARAYAGQ
jgi:hypothetical protein